MIRSALAVAVLAFGATALVAQNDPIAARKALMKSNGGQDRIAVDMVQAKRPFDLDEAKKALATFAEAGEKAPALFPDDSKAGDTAALPAVCENKAIVERLHQAVVASLQDADVRAKLAETGLRIVGNSPAEFAAFLAQEIEKFSSVVKAANIKAE